MTNDYAALRQVKRVLRSDFRSERIFLENQNVRNFQHPTCPQKLRINAYIHGYVRGYDQISGNP